jgi:glyoxylase-like metal-dependent hydrolase (beta-lactamase superfamily II)
VFVVVVASVASVAGVVGTAGAQQQKTADVAKRGLKPTDFPRARQLVPGVYSYEALRAGDPGGQMTTVSLIVISNDGVLVADGQGNVAQTKEMVDWIKKTTTQPIKYVIVCSDHGDHTGGNAAFPEGVTFVAHPTSKKVLDDAGKPPFVTVAVPHKKVIHLGTTDVEVLFLGRAHTGGDLEVYLPKEKVLFMSEAYLHWLFPAMRSAYGTEWIQTLKNAETIDATWYVPGHGFVDDAKTLKADLPAYRHALEQVVAEATRLHDAKVACEAPQRGRGGGGATAAASGGGRSAAGGGSAEGSSQRPMCPAVQQGNWGDLKNWTLYSSQVETAVRRVYDELDGKLPGGFGSIPP